MLSKPAVGCNRKANLVFKECRLRFCRRVCTNFSSDYGNAKDNKGALATTTATATKTSLENVTLRNFHYFAIIPICSTCTLWAKYAGTKFMETAFMLGRERKNSPSCAQEILNLVISRRCFAGDGKKMYKNINARAQ